MAPLFCALLIFVSSKEIARAESLSSLKSAVNLAKRQKLAQHQTWKSLLHYQDDTCYIRHPSFLLSSNRCSLEAELEATLSAIYERSSKEGTHAICRFPARYYFLRTQLATGNVTLPTLRCVEFEEYLRRAPAETIALAYASENVTQPASIMGHVFLKLAGTNEGGALVEHAVSYFTRIDTANIPLLIAKSFVLGMPSFFALVPYDEQLERYRSAENRNVWEYSLSISEEARKLIHYHIWELRDVKSEYLFAGYNCATVVYFILSLAEPSFLNEDRLWVTALDVVKQTKKNGLIAETVLHPSNIWKMRMLATNLGDVARTPIYEAIESKDPAGLVLSKDAKTNFLQRELGKTIVSYLWHNKRLSPGEFNGLEQAFKEQAIGLENKFIDVGEYKNPLFRPEDSQISLGYLLREKESFLKVNFLPASHKLTDDNRQSFSETALELGDVSVLVDMEDGSIELDELKLFSSVSLIPWDHFSSSISGKLQMGIERHYDKKLDSFSAANISGGLGLSSLVHEDVLVYSLANLGIGYGSEKVYPYGYPEIGVVINQVLNMKGIGSYSLICHQGKSSSCYEQAEISQSIFLDPTSALLFGYKRTWNSTEAESVFEFSLRRYF